MICPDSRQPVLILAVGIDQVTGDVVPIGGSREAEHGQMVPLIPGDKFCEPLSSLEVRLTSGYLNDGVVYPACGGYQTLLDSSLLAVEARVMDIVRQYRDMMAQADDMGLGRELNVRHEQSVLETTLKDLEKARTRCKASLLQTQHNLIRRQERANILSLTGGSPGMYEFYRTGQLLPILIGTTMEDMSGNDMQVPILGADRDRKTGNIMPLGGTMEDPEGSGLMPIQIGNKAVDLVTGELSPVIGVRLSPDTGTVIPVTQSSGGVGRRKAPAGAASALEDEVASRRAFWRRQRQREEELTLDEFTLAQNCLYDIDSVSATNVERALSRQAEFCKGLDEAAKAESQRRADAEPEYTQVLPPDVVSLLTDADELERKGEELHLVAHNKYAGMVSKFFEKLAAEEAKFREKLVDLEGAMNPEAELAHRNRHELARARLCVELKDHILNKMKALDEAHSYLEYIRERAAMLAREAKAVLNGEAMPAGTFDCFLSGVYGESDLTSKQANSELVPLLKHLISLLESGGPFVLSPELLNIINGGDINMYNLQQQLPLPGGGVGGGGDVLGIQQVDAPPQTRQMSASLVQKAGPAAREPTLSTQMDATALIDVKRLASSSGIEQSEEEKRSTLRDLVTKQTYEAAKLESDLRGDEIGTMNEINEEIKAKKASVADQAAQDLAAQLVKARSDADREKLMLTHAADMAKLTETLEQQRLQQHAGLRQKLLDKRRKQRKDLHIQHISEARSLGLPADCVPDMTVGSHDELDTELRRLAHQQEKLSADVEHTAAEQKAGKDPDAGYDDETEQRLRALKVLGEKEEEVLNSLRKKKEEMERQSREFREKLRQRKDRGKIREAVAGVDGLTLDEQALAQEAAGKLTETDRLNEENRLIQAFDQAQREQLHAARNAALNEALKDKTDEERRKLMAQFEDDCVRIKRDQDSSRNTQHEAMLAKIAAKKRMREELNKEKAVAAELDRITQIQAARGDEVSAAVITEISSTINTAGDTAKQQQLLQEQQLRQSDMLAKQQREHRELSEQAEDDVREQCRKSDHELDEQKQMALSEQRERYDRECLLAGKTLSEEEFQQLMNAHKEAQAKIEANYEQERQRGKQNVQDKLLARRRARELRLAERQEVELQTELASQQQERDKLSMDQAKTLEDSKLKESLKDVEGAAAESLIYTVLRQRHTKEAVHLEDQLERERKARLAQARSDMADSRAEQRDILVAANEKELMDLMGNTAGLTANELEDRKRELEDKQRLQLSDFDKLTVQMIDRAEKDIKPHLEVEQVNARLSLKEKHLNELSDAMASLNPGEVLIKQAQEDALRASEEAAAYRESTLKQMREEMERQKEERKRRDEERKKRMMEQLAQMESDLTEESRREELREKARQENRERTRQQQLKEKQEREKKEIENADVTEEERDRLMREHKENTQKFDDALKQEQQKSKAALKAKLAARRRRKAESQRAGLEKEDVLSAEADGREEVMGKMKEEAITKSQDKENQAKPDKQKTSGGGVSSSGNTEQDCMNLLLGSPLFQQIADVQDLIDKNMDAQTGGNRDIILGADYGQPYIDVKDAQWLCRGELTPLDLNDMTPGAFVVYRYGVFIIRLLNQAIQTPDVTLLLASNLPTNNYEKNAFRKSFFYERARRVLFVRRERLESIGDFVLVLLHCLAHIKVDDLTDDGNPLFLREFYKAMKIVCQDMFFSRSKSTPTSVGLLGVPPSAGGRQALQSAFMVANTQDDRGAVTGELLDVKVKDPTQAEYTEQAVSERIAGYEKITSAAQLRQMLAGQGGTPAQTDVIAARLAELKGHPETPDQALKSGLRPISRLTRITSQKQLLESQITDIETKCDSLNAELAQVLKQESELREGVHKLQSDPEKEDQLTAVSEQIENFTFKRESLLTQLTYLEADLQGKKKDLKKAK